MLSLTKLSRHCGRRMSWSAVSSAVAGMVAHKSSIVQQLNWRSGGMMPRRKKGESGSKPANSVVENLPQQTEKARDAAGKAIKKRLFYFTLKGKSQWLKVC